VERTVKMLKKIPIEIREYIYHRDKGICRICRERVEKEYATVHHLYHRQAMIPAFLEVPWVRSNNHPYNLILVCPQCHSELHSGDDLPKRTRNIMIKLNQELEYLCPFPNEVKEWLEKNQIYR